MKRKNCSVYVVHTIVLITAVLALLVSFNSCDDPMPDMADTSIPTDTTTMPEDSVQTSTDTTPDTTIDDVDDVENNDDQIHNEPSLFIAFSSLEDVRTFVQCTNAGEDEYKANTPKPVVHYTEACRVVPYLTSLPIPTVNSEDITWDVSVEFYDYGMAEKKLIVYYDIEEIRYSFVYHYDDAKPEPEGEPVHTVALDGYSVKLYGPNGRWYNGQIICEASTIKVSIRDAADITAITLDHFDLLPLIPEAE